MRKLICTAAFLLFSSLSWAAFPSIDNTNTSTENAADVTSHGVDLPATINADDLCLVLFTSDGTTTITWDNSTAGTWSQVYDTDGTGVQGALYAQVMGGTEDGATLTITTNNAERSTHLVVCISGANNDLTPVADTIAYAQDLSSDSTPNPPALNPANWGTEDTLWIATYQMDDGADSVLTMWSEANNRIENTGGHADNTGTVLSSANSAAASRDPSSYWATANSRSIATTIAIRPPAPPTVIEALAYQYYQQAN